MKLKVIDIETAKLAKEVGICIGTMTYYFNDEQLWDETSLSKTIKTPCYNQLDDCLEAPTQELLRQFLRTEYNIEVEHYRTEEVDGYHYGCQVEHWEGDEVVEVANDYAASYEKALEAGLKEALNYLLNQKE